MKRFILFFLMLCQLVTGIAQQSNTVTKSDLLTKSKKQKTTAYIMLGGGVAAMGLGLLIGNRKNSSFGEAGTGVVIGGLGFLSAVGSIPVFSSASRNKRKAMALAINIDLDKMNSPYAGYAGSYPGVSIKFSFH